jgi:hypothetical protein
MWEIQTPAPVLAALWRIAKRSMLAQVARNALPCLKALDVYHLICQGARSAHGR